MSDSLTIKEYINEMNYQINEIHFDKFYQNISNGNWVYMNDSMILYMGYSDNDIKKGKLSYSKLLETNFKENIDYRYYNNKEFKESSKSFIKDLENIEINEHNKVKHLIVFNLILNISLKYYYIYQKAKMENEIIKKENKELLTINEFIVNKNYNMENIYVDRFWGNINKDTWLYIDEILIDWIGYKKSNGKFKYIDIIKKNFELNKDYKLFDYNEITNLFHSPLGENEINKEILQFKDKITDNLHNRTQHIILSPRCFKKSLMIIKTQKANIIRDYYIDLEDIYKDYSKYQNQYQLEYQNDKLLELENKQEELEEKISYKDKLLEEKEEEIEEVKSKNFLLIDQIKSVKKFIKDGNVYSATSLIKSKNKIHKIGKSKFPKQRSSNFNTTALKGDETYYTNIVECYNQDLLEKLLHNCFSKFHCNLEWYNIHFESFNKLFNEICTNYNNCFELINNYIESEFKEDLQIKTIIPDPIDLNEIYKEKTEELRFKDNQNENIIIYENIKYYLCPRYCGYLAKESNKLTQHNKRVNKCTPGKKIDTKNKSIIEELIKKNNIEIYKCNDCNKFFCFKYLLQNHLKSSVKCSYIELEKEKTITKKNTQNEETNTITYDLTNEITLHIVKSLSKIYNINFDNNISNELILYMENNKNILDKLITIHKCQNNIISPVVSDINGIFKDLLQIFNIFNYKFDFNNFKLMNPNEINLLTSKEIIPYFKQIEIKSLNSINNYIRSILKKFNFNLLRTRKNIDGIRIEVYFIKFNYLNTTYIPLTEINNNKYLDDIIYYINDNNNVSIKKNK
jgi:hypothetical protein